jgi:hypothetical protein
VRDRVRRRSDAHSLSPKQDLAGVGGSEAKDDARERCPTRTHEPGQSDDLAGVHRQGDVVHADVARTHGAELKHRLA